MKDKDPKYVDHDMTRAGYAHARGSGEPLSPDGVLSRRTIVAGAAWAIPAVTMAVATPAFASSGSVVQFNSARYSGVGCSSITGVSVTVSKNGAASAGAPVTLTLSAGYSFAGSGTTYSGVTSSSGIVSAPAINIPMQGGSGTISAVSNGASVSSSLSASPAGGTVFNVESGSVYGSNQPSTLSLVAITKDASGYEYLVGLTSDNFLWRMTSQSGQWVKITNETTGIAAADGLAVYIRNGLVLDASTGTAFGTAQPGTIYRAVVTTDAAGYKYLLGLTSDNFLWRMTSQSGQWVKITNETTGIAAADGLAVYIRNGLVLDASTGLAYGSSQPGTFARAVVTTDAAGYKYLLGLTSDNFLWRMTSQSGQWVKITNETTGIAAADGLAVYIRNGLVLDASTGSVFGSSQPGTFNQVVVTTSSGGYMRLVARTSDSDVWTMTTQSGAWTRVSGNAPTIAAGSGLAIYTQSSTTC
ncbi:CTP-dependent riboflavin kinase [Microbacterium sp. SORGH_AS 1204]|uniref:hypothetical protein n=1 Tax=Microbacterium sp. SORGH_AS_1204 TaxID=3041785 RepID=UPI00278ECEDB|nr:hypothetical protein [Microbacterium sp. SORGH_AS_1204]MDQ1138309.1 CTP-dependent riboflavin kinase [Microbacterium sp. SORGH_AS_1204]